MKKALISGIAGQDGSYLAELLLSKGYEVHGIVQRESLENETKLKNIHHIVDNLVLHEGSLYEYASVYSIVSKVLPDECYHLAATSFVNYNLNDEFAIMNNNFSPTHFLLSSINHLKKECKFFLAGSSEMFGEPEVSPQSETTNFNPKSLYGIAKLSSYYLVKNYRNKENLYACTGIMFNHESPRRKAQFVTKKIVSSAVKIKLGIQEKLLLGNIDGIRDWGYAPEYVNAMWLMLQNNTPTDYVISTGIPHTVKDFLDITFSSLDLDYRNYIEIDTKFYRASEHIPLIGNSQKIYSDLGWKSEFNLETIIQQMLKSELNNYTTKVK